MRLLRRPRWVTLLFLLALPAGAAEIDPLRELEIQISMTPDLGQPGDFLDSQRPADVPRIRALLAARASLRERLEALGAEAAASRRIVTQTMAEIWRRCAVPQPAMVTGSSPQARSVLAFLFVRKDVAPLPIDDVLQVQLLTHLPFPSGARPDGTPIGRDFIDVGYFTLPRRAVEAPWTPEERAGFVRDFVTRRDAEIARVRTDFTEACP